MAWCFALGWGRCNQTGEVMGRVRYAGSTQRTEAALARRSLQRGARYFGLV